jgi:hypothetical protein
MRASDAVHAPLVADVAIRKLEPGRSVVRLLGDDAVQSDVAVSQVTHAVLPDLHAQALATKAGLDDVETNEAEVLIIGDGGEARDRFATPKSDEESVRVRLPETARVVQTGIPALCRRPFD